MYFKYNLCHLFLFTFLFGSTSTVLSSDKEPNYVDVYTLSRFVDDSLMLNSNMKTADLRIKRLVYDLDQAASQLGWVLSAQGGVSRNSSIFGIESDVADLTVGMERLLESGNTLSLTGRYEYSDSEQSVSALSPNPQDKINLDLNYRVPLLEGESNLKYFNAINKAKIESKIAEFEKVKIKEQLTLQLINVFYTMAVLDARLKTANKSLDRTIKLRRYIKSNIELGLLEKGEILQIDSQIYTLKLELKKILELKKQQIIAVNRFLKKSPDSDFITEITQKKNGKDLTNSSRILLNIKSHSTELNQKKLKSELLDLLLYSSKDKEKSKLDLVLSLGVQDRSGSNSGSNINDTDTTGMIRLEYRNALDKRTFSSERLKIQIDREQNKEEFLSITEDLEYDAHKLIANIEKSREILELAKLKKLNEEKKYKDILKRFKRGRTTTNILIQFDNEKIRSELELDTEKYEYYKRIDLLNLKQGLFFNDSLINTRGES